MNLALTFGIPRPLGDRQGGSDFAGGSCSIHLATQGSSRLMVSAPARYIWESSNVAGRFGIRCQMVASVRNVRSALNIRWGCRRNRLPYRDEDLEGIFVWDNTAEFHGLIDT